jgi:hypothetical protein
MVVNRPTKLVRDIVGTSTTGTGIVFLIIN